MRLVQERRVAKRKAARSSRFFIVNFIPVVVRFLPGLTCKVCLITTQV